MGIDKDTMTQMMSSKPGVVGADDRKTPPPGYIRAHTRAAWHFVRPAVHKTTWWVLLGIAVLMVLWEVDALWSGTIYGWLGWIRDNVLKRFPLVPFGLGMLVYHYVLRADRREPHDQ
jgi:hypothetical protein